MPLRLKINSRQSDNFNPVQGVDFLDSISLNLIYDSVASTFQFEYYFDPENKKHVELAAISHFHECSIYYYHEKTKREQLLLTGFMIHPRVKSSKNPELMKISGYSKPGALEDCDIATKYYPLESVGLNLRQITSNLIAPFNFTFKIDKSASADASVAFEEPETEKEVDEDIDKSTAQESTNIKSYLTELANQRNLVYTHTPNGDLLITQANTNGNSVLDITDTSEGVIDIELDWDGQRSHSQIEVIKQADKDGGNEDYAIIKNPFVPVAAVYRPKVVTLSSTSPVSAAKSVLNELGKDLKAIRLTITLDRGSFNDNFITQNNIVTVLSRRNYLYTRQKWFIESIGYKEDAKGEQMVLNCVLPYVYRYYTRSYDGKHNTPFNYFIDPHKNLPSL